jgi:hypothetical protein
MIHQRCNNIDWYRSFLIFLSSLLLLLSGLRAMTVGHIYLLLNYQRFRLFVHYFNDLSVLLTHHLKDLFSNFLQPCGLSAHSHLPCGLFLLSLVKIRSSPRRTDFSVSLPPPTPPPGQPYVHSNTPNSVVPPATSSLPGSRVYWSRVGRECFRGW